MERFKQKYIAMRQTIIEDYFSKLNDKQKEAALYTEGPLLILAGAGSGKTTVLINRIVNILKFGQGYSSDFVDEKYGDAELSILAQFLNGSIDENIALPLCKVYNTYASEILAITFTNKAAKELKERLEFAIGENNVWAQTFHSACLRILRRDIDRVGHSSDFTIYDEDDRKKTLKEIIKSMNLDDKMYDSKKISGIIGRAKDSLKDAKVFSQESSDYFNNIVSNIYTEYEKRLISANALDFDDIIFKTVRLLRENEDVLQYYKNKFKYVLVDEYQDTNHAQYVLTGLLSSNNICVVGDDDQSIYKFRGAEITNILQFEKQYKNAKSIRLEQNYRSSKNILSIANGIISNNTTRTAKKLWTNKEIGDISQIFAADNQDEEAEYIAKNIIDNYKEKWSDFAVLYRSNVLSNNIEYAFKRNSIPYKIISGRRFFDRLEIKDMFAYLWLIQNNDDNLRFKRIVNSPARKIGNTTLENIEEISKNEQSFFNVAKNAYLHSELSRSASNLVDFTDMITYLQSKSLTLPLTEFYDEMLKVTGYLKALEEKNDAESNGRIENILELKSNIIDYISRAESPTLSNFLEEMSLFTDMDNDNEADFVVMMTMHASKGLEFKNVFLCGMEDGIFPSLRSSETTEDMEEERRLCYVAITRAKEKLFLTYAKRRMIYGQTKYNRASQFLNEIPKESIETNDIKVSDNSSNDNKNIQKPSIIRKKDIVVLELKIGDKVNHKVFGIGSVVNLKPMAGDFLLEITFEKHGSKKLLRNSASEFMVRA